MADLAHVQTSIKHGLQGTSRPLFLQTRGSVWSSTKLPIAAFSAYALLIYLLNNAGLAPNFGRGASSLSAVLSMTVGLMLSYRSSSSSERWHNGRQIFASLNSSIRSMTTLLYLTTQPPHDIIATPKGKSHKATVNELLDLVMAYCYAFKNHLRDRDSLNDPDFQRLLPRSMLQSFKATPAISRTLSEKNTDEERFKRVLNEDVPHGAPRAVPATKLGGPKNMPLLLLRQIQSYLNDFHSTLAPSTGNPNPEMPIIDNATWATCMGICKEMTDQLSQAERIRDTPIPMALGIHVSQMLLLYCLSIPPQMVDVLGLWIVPVSAIVAWTFWGIDSAAAQLSDPFGTDANDLPTDRFVRNMHDEYLELVGTGQVSGSAGNDQLLGLPAGVGTNRSKDE